MNFQELLKDNKGFIFKAFIIFVFLFILVRVSGFARFHKSGMDYDNNTNVITITGHGEVNAVPDIATISFSITKDGKTVKESQALVAEIEAKVISSLKENKIEDKDIKTTNSSFYPKYEYQASSNREIAIYPPVENGRQVIVGYTATQSITVKVRDTDNAGKVISDLGVLGVTDLSGPNFAIDNEDGLKAEARKKAIEDARTKAKVLAKDLGVNLGKITSFSETPNYGGNPIYYSAKASLESSDASAPAVLPKGENTVSSDVTITYKIR